MKLNGILNSEISKVLSDLGHTDQIVISDAGLPVPTGVKKIDLALKYGFPSFIDVLEVVLTDMKVEKIILADQIKTANKPIHEKVQKIIDENIECTYISHEEFKQLNQNAKVIIRTGENTPYANIILQSGVTFG